MNIMPIRHSLITTFVALLIGKEDRHPSDLVDGVLAFGLTSRGCIRVFLDAASNGERGFDVMRFCRSATA